MGRLTPLFVIVAAPVVASTLRASDGVLGKPAVSIVGALVGLLIAGRTFADFPSKSMSMSAWVNRHGPGTPGYPCGAADFVAARMPRATGRVINEFSWGGYLAWRLGPADKVLLDGRTQIYSADFWHQTYLGTDADRDVYFSGVAADAAILPVDGSVFRATLVKLGWTPAFRDQRAEVWVPPALLANVDGS